MYSKIRKVEHLRRLFALIISRCAMKRSWPNVAVLETVTTARETRRQILSIGEPRDRWIRSGSRLVWQIVETLPVSLIVYYGTMYYTYYTHTYMANDHNHDKLFLRTSSWPNWPIIGAMIQFQGREKKVEDTIRNSWDEINEGIVRLNVNNNVFFVGINHSSLRMCVFFLT